SPWFCQKVEVSVTSGSITTMYFSLLRQLTTLFLSGKDATGLKPWQNHGESNDVDPASIQTEVFRLPSTC
ncbi:hypothetical protein IBK40_27755, partial [Escherichia coli]|nr:hypothetical protein [Escherichia coli]